MGVSGALPRLRLGLGSGSGVGLGLGCCLSAMGMETSNNAEFICQYTTKVYEEAKKGNDILTDKLTKVMAFSGVLLKFGCQQPRPEGTGLGGIIPELNR